ncbi:glutaminase [Scytonema sp. HK-05]|uniref:glutaminase A n=1 Tax=Scytonema sp. HK-05 TaxID=1137095 RepID=UPI000936AD21|nr:glutaminase A [Scytonema sp. HK-05]OKH57583.1 glutaminase A [Scytonema sp. HK-05]BAY44604.1 glutaminase [Scytonema sp. HK-05]
MVGLERLTITKLSAWAQQAKVLAHQGQVANRIPKLALANPDWFAVHICCASGQTFSQGDTSCVFPLMSAIKPFSLLYLLEQFGAETVFQWVGVEPSDAPFNSLEQLIADHGRPRNPMINSGAITLADKLPGKDASDRCQQLCQWLNQLAGSHLKLDEVMLASVRASDSQANQAITQYLTEAGYVKNPDIALDTYEQICCLSGNVEDLARLGLLLAVESELILPQHRRILNSLMLSCGLYAASSEYALRIGLPMKSGISGAVVAIVPNQGAIALYSPALDSIGNSIGAIAFVEALSQGLQLSVFG